MNIVDDEESATGQAEPWPVRAAAILDRRPRLAVGTAVVALTVVALLSTSRTGEPATVVPPSATPGSLVTTPAQLSLAGLAYQSVVAVPGAQYDLIFAITPGPRGISAHTHVYRLDAVKGEAELLHRWPADEEARVFADSRGRAMVIAWQSALSVFAAGRPAVANGPELDVGSVLFLGPDDDPARDVLASTSESLVDITQPQRQRVVANVGGTLIGRLDDGRVVLASMGAGELVIRAVALNGTVVDLARVPQALGPAALQRFPTATSPLRVLVLRRAGVGSVVSGVDLETGAISDLQILGLDATFAPETARPGLYVYTHSVEPHIQGRGTPDIEVPPGRRAYLDPLRSWSPDGALIAFTSQAAAAAGVTALTRDGRLLVDLQPDEFSRVTLVGWIRRP